jgi:hypothetical protein
MPPLSLPLSLCQGGRGVGEGPQPLLWVGLWAARVKITISGIPNHLSWCVIL